MIEVYTDGGYASSRDIGGWAYVVVEDGVKIQSDFYPVPNTTNNRMEIQAVIEACLWVKSQGYTEITLFTDSMYIIGTMTMEWKRKKNEDLWLNVDMATEGLRIHWRHIKGHSGNKYNELCDALAVQATFIT